MNRKSIAIVAGAGGLLAAAFFAGSVLMKDGNGSTRVIAGGVTPVPGISATVTVTPIAENGPATTGTDPETDADNNNGNSGSNGGSGSDNGQPQGAGNGGNGGGGQPQQPAPEPEPENPEPEPQPEPEPEPEPEPDQPVILVAIPQVSKVSPTKDAIGIANSSNIVVTFSKAMNQASAQAAFAIQPAIPGAFSWDASGKVMTFNPNANFAYGTEVSISVQSTATDLGGKTMKNDFSSEFRILRRSSTTLVSEAPVDGTVYAPAVQVLGDKAISNLQTFDVGTWQRGFVSFNLAMLPADLTKIEAAEFSIYQTAHDGGAYTAATGNLVIKSVTYGSLDASDWGRAANQFCLGPCVDLQVTVSNNALNGWKGADLLGMVNLDWANRADRNNKAQFRLQFVTENNGAGADVSASFATGHNGIRPTLEVTYLHP